MQGGSADVEALHAKLELSGKRNCNPMTKSRGRGAASIYASLLLVQVTTTTAPRLDFTGCTVLPLPNPDAIDYVVCMGAEVDLKDIALCKWSYLISIGCVDCRPVVEDVIWSEELIRANREALVILEIEPEATRVIEGTWHNKICLRPWPGLAALLFICRVLGGLACIINRMVEMIFAEFVHGQVALPKLVVLDFNIVLCLIKMRAIQRLGKRETH